MKRHVFGATLLLFLVLLACKSRSSRQSAVTTAATTAEPAPVSTTAQG